MSKENLTGLNPETTLIKLCLDFVSSEKPIFLVFLACIQLLGFSRNEKNFLINFFIG